MAKNGDIEHVKFSIVRQLRLELVQKRQWIEREEAVREFTRWMGFSRTGPVIEDTSRSVINGLLRESRLQADGPNLIRRCP
jgi:hypothetical protein